eukprot:TRINITY_DN12640_c0_g1_i1.p1 TRINITY_DN12640_c0_g1~~TRINITY_DN12640_c0_g1_i1.p1  ORF type:complete len:869 (-),score=81.27 TRINITY_DN12640_c0_g1_i1:10-2616(-)
MEGTKWHYKVVDLILWHPSAVLIAVLVFVLVTALPGLQLIEMSQADASFSVGDQKLLDQFGNSGVWHDAVVMWCKDCSLYPLHGRLAPLHADVIRLLSDLRTSNDGCSDLEYSDKLEISKHVSADKTTAIVKLGTRRMACLKSLRRRLQRLKVPEGVAVTLGGPFAVGIASTDAMHSELEHHVLLALPINFVFLWYFMGRLARPFLPLLCGCCAFLCGRCVVVLCKKWDDGLMTNYQEAPVFYLALGFAIDFNLFFWARFTEERAAASGELVDVVNSYRSIVATALEKSGEVICLSTGVMVLMWSGTLFIDGLNDGGFLAMCIHSLAFVFLCGVFSVLVCPASALVFQSCLDSRDERGAVSGGRSKTFWTWWARYATTKPCYILMPCIAYVTMALFIYLLPHYVPNYDVIELGSVKSVPEYEAYQQFRSQFDAHFLPVVFVLEARDVGAAPDLTSRSQLTAAPVARPTLKDDLSAVTRLHSERTVRKSLRNAGRLDTVLTPEHMTDRPKPIPSGVWQTVEFGAVACAFVEHLLADVSGHSYQFTAEDVSGAWWSPGASGSSMCTPFPVLQALVASKTATLALANIKPENVLADLDRRRQNIADSTSKHGDKQLLMVYPKFSPTGSKALNMTRFVMERLEPSAARSFFVDGRQYEFDVRHTSAIKAQLDDHNAIMSSAPWPLGIACGAVAVFVGVFFRSVFLPAKLVITVLVPIMATYGLVIGVYQFGMLGWMGCDKVAATGGVSYKLPYVTMGLLFGLAMDYDIFLFSRVYEYRQKGYDNSSAVRLGLIETGPVVTVAGSFMALSYFFVVFASSPIVRHVGFTYTVGVLVDTFIIRACIAPGVLCIAMGLNYWPGYVPPVDDTKSLDN